MEYVKQGFPPTLAEADPRSSASLLPRPLNTGILPMSITSIPLWDGHGGQSHPPSRLSSKTTLPQLGTFFYTYVVMTVDWIEDEVYCTFVHLTQEIFVC